MIKTEWFDGNFWVDDGWFDSLDQAVSCAFEQAKETPFGEHRVTVDDEVYATFRPMGLILE